MSPDESLRLSSPPLLRSTERPIARILQRESSLGRTPRPRAPPSLAPGPSTQVHGPSEMTAPSKRWQFWIDRGGTFTDVVGKRPDGSITTLKLLSENPEQYRDCLLYTSDAADDLLC